MFFVSYISIFPCVVEALQPPQSCITTVFISLRRHPSPGSFPFGAPEYIKDYLSRSSILSKSEGVRKCIAQSVFLNSGVAIKISL